MRMSGTGHVLFAAGLAGLGLLSVISGDFALTACTCSERCPPASARPRGQPRGASARHRGDAAVSFFRTPAAP